MKPLTIGSAYFPALPAEDCALTALNGRLTRGLNLDGRGASASLGPTDLAGNRVIAAGRFTELTLKGLRGDFREKRTDGIGLACAASIVRIEDCRLTGILGEHKDRHGDGVQVHKLARIDVLAITNTTIATAYQGIMSSANPNGEGVKTLYLDRVNIRDEPSLRQEKSFALYLGDRLGDGKNTAPYTIILGPDVWIDWPDADKLLFLPVGARVIGSVKRGIPPGGDFCPA